MATFEQKVSLLISELLQRTRNRRLSWSPTARADSYLAALNSSGVLLQQAGGVTLMSVLDGDGNPLEVWNASDLPPSDARRLRELFTLARRSAHKIEEGLDSILQEIQRI